MTTPSRSAPSATRTRCTSWARIGSSTTAPTPSAGTPPSPHARDRGWGSGFGHGAGEGVFDEGDEDRDDRVAVSGVAGDERDARGERQGLAQGHLREHRGVRERVDGDHEGDAAVLEE